jgi:hypothetical protein
MQQVNHRKKKLTNSENFKIDMWMILNLLQEVEVKNRKAVEQLHQKILL